MLRGVLLTELNAPPADALSIDELKPFVKPGFPAAFDSIEAKEERRLVFVFL